MSSQQNKLQRERNQKQLLELVALPGNNICADCKARNPRWASYNLGIFICMHCASIHRKIGTHITKVKSLTMDDWTKEQVEHMKSMGNVKSNAIYNPNELRYPPPPNLEDSERDSEIEQYIRSKYQYKKYLDKSALVASKLGPSKSMPSVVKASSQSPSAPSPKSSSSPVTSHKPTTSSTALSIPHHPVSAKVPENPSRVSGNLPAASSTLPSRGGVWDDLCSLNGPGQNSSLPLQFQAPSQPPMLSVNGALNVTGYSPVGGVTSNGMVLNPFPAQQIGFNALSQQPLPSSASYVPPLNSSFTGWGPTAPQPNTPIMPQPISAATPFFQPQGQVSLQVQMSSTPSILSHSPSGQPVMSAPPLQTQFLTPSPSQQFLSHSPQLQARTPLTAQGGYALVSTTPILPATQLTTPMGQTGFLSTTTMQMQQQQILLQQQALQQQQQQQLAQQQQMAHQQLGSSPFAMTQTQMQQPMMFGASNGIPGTVGGFVGTPMYTQGQQWGAM